MPPNCEACSNSTLEDDLQSCCVMLEWERKTARSCNACGRRAVSSSVSMKNVGWIKARKPTPNVWSRKSGSYPKIDVRQGKTSWRYATSISLGEMGFLEFSHHVSTEMYVDTRKWLKSSGETGTLPHFRPRSSSFSSRQTIPAKTE